MAIKIPAARAARRTALLGLLAALALARSRAGTRLDMRGFGRAAQGRTMSVISMLFS